MRLGAIIGCWLVVSSALAVSPARVIVAGNRYTGSPAAQNLNGIIWGPVAPICRMLGAQVSGDAQGCELVTVAGERFLLRAGDKDLRRGEETVPLEGAPLVAGGRLVAPLPRLLKALGAKVTCTPGKGLLIANARVVGMELRGGPEGLSLRLRVTGPVSGSLHWLREDKRVFVDLRGAELDTGGSRYLGVAGAYRLRWAQFSSDPAVARFVLDLYQMPEARWRSEPGGGAFELGKPGDDPSLFTPQAPSLLSADLETLPGQGSQVRLAFSGPVEYEYRVSSNPYRLILSFPDALGVVASQRSDSGQSPIRELQVAPETGRGLRVELLLGWLMRFQIDQDAEARELRLTMEPDALVGKRIIVDPGHGGKDAGARYKGLLEKDINLAVGTRLVTRLIMAGAQAWLTRDRDEFLGLPDRPAVATATEADVFVSVHCNAMPRPNQHHGTESYYYTPQSQMLAHVLQRSLVGGLGRRDNGVRQRRFAVLWRPQQPAALVELMYLNHDAEHALLRTPEVQERAVEALFDGLRGYFEGMPL